MIQVKDVVKTFDGFRALDGLTMTVPSGSIYGLVGPNGAGKSTILRHINGVYRQDSGEVLVDGAPVYALMPGTVRGMLPEGLEVTRGMKSGDIDPRCQYRHCFTISDKARAIGGGVLEGLLYFSRRNGQCRG